MVTEFLDGNRQKRKGKIGEFFPTKLQKTKKMASSANVQEFHRMLALWTATSLRPFSIVEDRELQNIITFASQVHGDLRLPTRNTNQKNVKREADALQMLVRKDIQENCVMFSATTDM